MKTIVALEGSKCGYHYGFFEDTMDTLGEQKELHKKFNMVLLEDLYKTPSKLVALKYLDPDYVLIRTTGVYADKINNLVEVFKVLDYTPKAVIFHSELSAMALLGLARELKEKGTKFYYYYLELEEITWI